MDEDEALNEGQDDALLEESGELEDGVVEEESQDLEDDAEHETEEGEKPEEEASEDSEEEGIYLEFEDGEREEPEESGSTISYIRKANRELKKEKRELEKRLAELQTPEPSVKLGPKPDLEDFDYDQDKYDEALLSWSETKRKVEAEQAEKQAAQKAAEDAWQAKLDRYVDARARIRNDDFELVEGLVQEKLSPVQQNLILAASQSPERDVYALGLSPKELDRLSEIDDQAQFIYELGILEGKRGKGMTKKAPKPEKRVQGSAPRSSAIQSKYEKLKDRAAQTGDRTELIRFRRKHGSKIRD